MSIKDYKKEIGHSGDFQYIRESCGQCIGAIYNEDKGVWIPFRLFDDGGYDMVEKEDCQYPQNALNACERIFT